MRYILLLLLVLPFVYGQLILEYQDQTQPQVIVADLTDFTAYWNQINYWSQPQYFVNVTVINQSTINVNGSLCLNSTCISNWSQVGNAYVHLSGDTMTGNLIMDYLKQIIFSANSWITGDYSALTIFSGGTVNVYAMSALNLESGFLVNIVSDLDIHNDISSDGTFLIYNSFLDEEYFKVLKNVAYSQSIIPMSSYYNLGSATTYWNYTYINNTISNNISAKDVYVNGSINITGGNFTIVGNNTRFHMQHPSYNFTIEQYSNNNFVPTLKSNAAIYFVAQNILAAYVTSNGISYIDNKGMSLGSAAIGRAPVVYGISGYMTNSSAANRWQVGYLGVSDTDYSGVSYMASRNYYLGDSTQYQCNRKISDNMTNPSIMYLPAGCQPNVYGAINHNNRSFNINTNTGNMTLVAPDTIITNSTKVLVNGTIYLNDTIITGYLNITKYKIEQLGSNLTIYNSSNMKVMSIANTGNVSFSGIKKIDGNICSTGDAVKIKMPEGYLYCG